MLLNYKNEITFLYNGTDVCHVFNSCFVHQKLFVLFTFHFIKVDEKNTFSSKFTTVA